MKVRQAALLAALVVAAALAPVGDSAARGQGGFITLASTTSAPEFAKVATYGSPENRARWSESRLAKTAEADLTEACA